MTVANISPFECWNSSARGYTTDMTTNQIPTGTRCSNPSTRVLCQVVDTTDVIVPSGMVVVELERTKIRKLAQLNGTTNRYGQPRLDLFDINTTVIDGACWGRKGRKTGTTAIMS